MRPLLTADVLTACSQEYEGREEEMDTALEKSLKKLNSFTTFHFTVRCAQFSCVSLYNEYIYPTYIFTTLNCVLNRYVQYSLGFAVCTHTFWGSGSRPA